MSSTSASRGRMPRHLLALASSIVLTAGVGIATAPAAFAADPPDTSASHASAQYLSVTGGPSTPGATADYYGNNTDTPDAAQQQSSAVASVDTSSVPGLTIQGAVGSAYAYANTGGSSWAASGRVTGPGSSGVVDPANVNIDLGALLGTSRIVEKMQLSLQEVSSIAKLDVASLGTGDLADDCGSDWSDPNTTNCRDYTLKSGSMHIQSKAISTWAANLKALAGQIDAAIGTLSVDLPDVLTNLLLAPSQAALEAAVVGHPIGPSLVTLGQQIEVTSASLGNPTVTIGASGSVLATLAGIVTGSHSASGVTLDLDAGTVDVNYDTLMHGLNGLSPNSSLFGPAVAASIQGAVNDIVDAIAAEVANDIEALLSAITVTVQITATPTAVVTTTPNTWVPAHNDGGTWVPDQICFPVVGCHDSPFSGHWDGGVNVPAAWVSSGPSTDTTISGLTFIGSYSGTLWQILDGGASIGLSITGWPSWLDALGLHSPTIDAITVPALLGGNGQAMIDDAASDAADFVKGSLDSAIGNVMQSLDSASSVFGGTINVQQDNADGSYRETALELWFNPGGKKASPLRGGGGAFRAAVAPAAYVGPPAGAVVVRLGTAIVGKNQPATDCPAGTHYDPTTRPPSCVKDSVPTVPGGGGGGGTPTTTPVTTTTTAPSTEVLGSSDTTTSPSVTVKGESSEAPQTTEVLGLAETGPHEIGLIAVLGLELLLGGIAIIRLTARRRRELTDQHHV